ncbi:MAG: hypothetical protein ABI700_04545 [Chloroflexota bacterium]
MTPDSNPYKDAARVYIRLIKRDNLEAGLIIEQISITYGAQAAVRAALVIALVKMSVKENYRIPDLSLSSGILENYPDVLPLVKHAVACCRLAWGVDDATLI